MAILVEPPRAIFGKNINRLRTQAGWTQDDVAGLAKIRPALRAAHRGGHGQPGIDVICRLRAALGASWEEILRGLGKAGRA